MNYIIDMNINGSQQVLYQELYYFNMVQWSQKYYKNLNKKQHLINNIWFNNILKQLKKDGFLYVPNINKSFNKQGQEIK